MSSSRLRPTPVRAVIGLAVFALLAAALLFSVSPLGPATETAEAQSATINYVVAVRNPDGSFTVPQDWPLLPPGVDPGQTFRLLFVTSGTITASNNNIANYNQFVQLQARTNGHPALFPYTERFKALVSVSGNGVAANANTETLSSGAGFIDSSVYFVNGAKVADNIADFYDGTWDTADQATIRDESGALRNPNPTGNLRIWTGSWSNGNANQAHTLGRTTVRYAIWRNDGPPRTAAPFNAGNPTSSLGASSNMRPIYALSPVFRMSTDASRTNESKPVINVEEGTTTQVYLKLEKQPAQNSSILSIYDGDAGVSIPINPTYTTSDWNREKNFQVRAAEDADSNHISGQLTLGGTTAAGVRSSALRVFVRDNDQTGPQFGVSLGNPEGGRINRAFPYQENEDSDSDPNTKETIGFAVSTGSTVNANISVCIRITEWYGDRVAASDEGLKTVRVASGNNGAFHRVPYANDNVDTPSSIVTGELLPPGVGGCTSTGYTVQGNVVQYDTDLAVILDDEATVSKLALTGPYSFAEGGGGTELTVTLNRALIRREAAIVPVTILPTGTVQTDEPIFGLSDEDGENVNVTARQPASSRDYIITFAGPTADPAKATFTLKTPIDSRSDDPEIWQVWLSDYSETRFSSITHMNMHGGVDRSTTMAEHRRDVQSTGYAVIATLEHMPWTSTVILQDTYNAQLIAAGDEVSNARLYIRLDAPVATGESFVLPIVSNVTPRRDLRGFRQAGHSFYVGTAKEGLGTLGTSTKIEWAGNLGTNTNVTFNAANNKLSFAAGATGASFQVFTMGNFSDAQDVLTAVGIGTPESVSSGIAGGVTVGPAPGSVDFPQLVIRRGDRLASSVRVYDTRYLKWTTPDDYVVYFNDDGAIKLRHKYIPPADTTANYHYDRVLNLWGSELDYNIEIWQPPLRNMTLDVRPAHSGRLRLSTSRDGPYTSTLQVTIEPDDPENPHRCEDPTTGNRNNDQSWRCTVKVWVKPLNNVNQAQCTTLTHQLTDATTGHSSGYHNKLGNNHRMQVQMHKHGAHFYPIADGAPSCSYLTPIPAPVSGFNWSSQPTSAGYAEYQACIARSNCRDATAEEIKNYGRGGQTVGMMSEIFVGPPPPDVLDEGFGLETGASTAGAVQLLREGESTPVTLRFSRKLNSGEKATFGLSYVGADIGKDFTLTLDAKKNPNVTVDAKKHLGTATPRLTVTGAQEITLTLTALKDGLREGIERLVIGIDEAYYNDGVQTWLPSRGDSIEVDIEDPPPAPPVTRLTAIEVGDSWAEVAWPAALGDVDYYAVVWYSPGASGSEEIYTKETVARITGLDTETDYDTVVIPFAKDGTILASMTAWFTTTKAGADTVRTKFARALEPDPVVSVTGGSGVTEGGNAEFTITASPAPKAALTVKLNVTQSGDYIASGDSGAKTVTVPTGGTVTYSVATIDDIVDEADGSVTATLASGTGYDIASGRGSATVTVADDDVTPVVSVTGGSGVTEGGNAVFTITASPAPQAALTVKLNVTQSGDYIASGDSGAKTVTVPTSGSATYTVATINDIVDEADGSVTATLSSGTGYAVSSTNGAATVSVADDDVTPVVSITGGSGVTEGGNAVFTITASPAPQAALTVKLNVTQSGDYIGSGDSGAKTVTVPTSGSATYSVGTINDTTDEPNGSVTATLSSGTGYAVSSTNGAATVSVADDDLPPPQASITAGSGVTEGGNAVFTITVSPAPSAALTVKLNVSQSGDYIGSGDSGAKTVTVPTSGSATYTVATINDTTDEPNGSVTATLSAGTGYAVSSTSGAATVSVADDDLPPPQASITAGSGVTEGGNAVFTITVSPAPSAALTVKLNVSQSGDYIGNGDSGAKTVTVPTSGSVTYTVATVDDTKDEADGSVTATLSAGTGYKVSSTNGAATVSVADDDVTPLVSIAAGSMVTEGGNVVFTITASPAPSAALTVKLIVAQSGDYIGSGDLGAKTVTVPTSGSATYTVATINDNIYEPNGSVSALISSGTGYVTSRARAASVEVWDNDNPPEASISAGSDVTEGGNAVFTITVTPAPFAAVIVKLKISQSGDYIGSGDSGAKTVTVPTSGTATYTVATVDDTKDEADGSVKVTLASGARYSVASGAGSASVGVSDNDDPSPFPVVTALKAFEITATSGTLAWPAIADADFYALTWYSPDAPDPQEEILTQTGFELTGLQPNTAYSASVLGFGEDGTIHIIGAIGFTTEAAP